jgi:hypothetical protein
MDYVFAIRACIEHGKARSIDVPAVAAHSGKSSTTRPSLRYLHFRLSLRVLRRKNVGPDFCGFQLAAGGALDFDGIFGRDLDFAAQFLRNVLLNAAEDIRQGGLLAADQFDGALDVRVCLRFGIHETAN